MTSVNKRALLEISDEFSELVEDPIIKKQLKADKSRLLLGLFRIVVVGEINKGKSTFINALLGTRDLLPATSDVTTSTVFKIMYGNEPQATVFWEVPKKGTKGEPTVVPLEDVHKFGSEDLNPDNEQFVDFIGIQSDNPLLKQGIAIIDTPGLGGLFRKHNSITWRYLPNADAVFFVTDSKETLISADEVEMLKKIQEITPYIFFVQTKCDLEEEEHCINWKERNEEILEEALNVPGKDLKYFNVSSELKLDADESHDRELLDLSGYPAILDFIQHKLLPNKERHISLKLKKNLASFSTTAEHKLEGKLQIYRAQTKSNFEALEDKYKSAKSTFDKWQSGKQQDVLSDLLRQSQDVVRNTRQRLLEDLNASRFGPIVAPIISEIRSSSMNANTVYDKAKWYGNRSENHCKEIVSKVIQAYAQQMNHVVADLAASLKSDLLFDSEVNIAVDSKSSESLKPDNDPGGWILGAFIKGSVAATVANLLLAPFSPFNLALTLFSGGAFVAGALKGKQGYENTKKDRVVARLEQLLETTVKDVQIKALHKFDALAATSSQTLVDSVKTIADVYKQEVDEAMKELEEVRNAPKGKFDAKAKTLEAKLAQVKALIKKLGPFAAAE